MQNVFKLCLAMLLVFVVSCRQDRREPTSVSSSGKTVYLSLQAEISVDDSNLRAIGYKLGKNSKDQLIPIPEFADNQKIMVHTIIKSTSGTVAVKTLPWLYDANKRKLVLNPDDGHSITIPNFNNDGGVKWYLSGLVGGDLIDGTTRVTFSGERVLQGSDGTMGATVGSLNVPYSFGWTELKIYTNSAKDADGSYSYAGIPKDVSVKFIPRGSLIAYQLGNAQTAGVYTFSPEGFTVATNTWGDEGEFNLDTDIPASNPETVMPLWSESSCGSTMLYTFANGHKPNRIAHGGSIGKTYYAWVMPHKAQPQDTEVHVMLKGESSNPDRDLTKTYFTDYAPKSSGSQGKVVEGRVHKLSANATHRVVLPIEYVTDYNLAGGPGLTYKTRNVTQPIGVKGLLRFSNYDDNGSPLADGHMNDASGYYNWKKLTDLQKAIDITFGQDKYYIPTLEQWWGIWAANGTVHWESNIPHSDKVEPMSVGFGPESRKAYLSDYSEDFYPRGNTETSDAVVYAIRFKARTNNCTLVRKNTLYEDSEIKSLYYPSALDNSMKCAYRFRRVGGTNVWTSGNLKSRIVIDVVYLGDESSPTDLATISNDEWWSGKQVISKTFPIPGYISNASSTNPFGDLSKLGSEGGYWSSWASSETNAYIIRISSSSALSFLSNTFDVGNPVRLFARRPL